METIFGQPLSMDDIAFSQESDGHLRPLVADSYSKFMVCSSNAIGGCVDILHARDCLWPVTGPTVPCVSSITPYQQDLVLINAFSLCVHYVPSNTMVSKGINHRRRALSHHPMDPQCPCEHQYWSLHSKHLSRTSTTIQWSLVPRSAFQVLQPETECHNASTIWSVGYMEKYCVEQQ